MYEKEVCVKNSVGLHSKYATEFIQKANKYGSLIKISKGEDSSNAKSLLGVLSLGIMGDTVVKITADGDDEEQAVEGLTEFLQNLK